MDSPIATQPMPTKLDADSDDDAEWGADDKTLAVLADAAIAKSSKTHSYCGVVGCMSCPKISAEDAAALEQRRQAEAKIQKDAMDDERRMWART